MVPPQEHGGCEHEEAYQEADDDADGDGCFCCGGRGGMLTILILSAVKPVGGNGVQRGSDIRHMIVGLFVVCVRAGGEEEGGELAARPERRHST